MDDSADVFLSYRREDTRHVAGRLADRLVDHVGEERVFIDIDSIDPGVDFEVKLLEAISKSAVMIVLIGPRWLEPIDKKGRRRLDNPHDFVYLELKAALQRRLHIIPVLIDGASMPSPQELPVPVRQLSRRNALRIDHESFRTDATRLIDTLQRYLTSPPTYDTPGSLQAAEHERSMQEQKSSDASQSRTGSGARYRQRVTELIASGNQLSVEGDQEGAIASYDEAIEMDPENAEAYAGRAVGHLLAGRTGQAGEDMTRARSIGVSSRRSIEARNLAYARGIVEGRRHQKAANTDAQAVRSCFSLVSLGIAEPVRRWVLPRIVDKLDRPDEIPFWMSLCTYGADVTVLRRPCILLITSERLIWASLKYRGRIEARTLDLVGEPLHVWRHVMGLQVDPEYELGIGPDGRPFCALSENLWANFSGGVEPYSLLFPLSAFPMTLEHIESVIRVLSGAVWMEGGGWVQYQRLTGSVVEISTSEPQWG